MNRNPLIQPFAKREMKRATTIYAVLAVILEVILARTYQQLVPGFRHIYASLYGENPLLPHITEVVLNHDWLFYIAPLLIVSGYLLAHSRKNNEIAVHFTFWGLILFLFLGVAHSFAIFLPLITTMGKLE